MNKNKRFFFIIFSIALLLFLPSCTRTMVSTPTDIEAIVKLPTLAATAEAALTADALLQPTTSTAEQPTTSDPQTTQSISQQNDQPTEPAAELPTHTPTVLIPTTTTAPPTLTPIPTSAISIDPQSQFGAPSKAFNHTNWNTFLTTKKDESYILIVDDGPLTFTSLYTQWDTPFHITTAPVDAYIEMNVEVEECADQDSYGILFRSAQNTTNGYIAQFSCDGQYSLWRLESYSPYTKNYLVNWTANSAINAGAHQANTLGVLVQANSIQLYANDVLLTELPIYDNLFPNGTRVALLSSPWETQNFTYLINSLNIWRIQ